MFLTFTEYIVNTILLVNAQLGICVDITIYEYTCSFHFVCADKVGVTRDRLLSKSTLQVETHNINFFW